MKKAMRRLMITGLVAGMCVMLLSGFAGATGNGSRLQIGKTMGGLRTAVAEALGLTTEDIYEARQAGKTLRQLLEEKNINVEEFVKEQVAARKSVIDQFVQEGKMTAEQAEICLANLEANLDARLDSVGGSCNGQGQGALGQKACGRQGRGAGRMMRGGFSWGK